MSVKRSAWMTPPGRILRPGFLEERQILAGAGGEPRGDAVGLRLRRLEERTPARDREGVRPLHREIGPGRVQAGERRAERPAMLDPRPAHRDALQERHDHGRPAAELPEGRAVAGADRLGAGEAVGGQMLHQPEEERQVVQLHPLLVEGEDVGTRGGVQDEVGVLHPLGDALVGQEIADLVGGKEGGQRLVRNLGVDRHGRSALLEEVRWRRSVACRYRNLKRLAPPLPRCGEGRSLTLQSVV